MAVQRLRRALAGTTVVLALVGCGSTAQNGSSTHARGRATTPSIPAALVRQRRPIGRGAAFHPPASGPVLGSCRRPLGPRDGAHVEVFALDRVVLIAAGIGARPPLHHNEGRITGAACFGELVTLEPTGVVLTRPGAGLTLADLFRSWGQPLTSHRLASFRATAGVRVYVDGRRTPGAPGAVRLRRHAEIVLEAGPYVPPHPAYRFPPGA